jgi:large subunit ribosomal protein L21
MTVDITTNEVSSETVSSETVSSEAEKKSVKSSSKASEPQAFAIVRTCGKQYRVTPGTRISIDEQEGNPGDTVTFSDVLMAGKTGGSDVRVLSAGEKSLGVTVTGRLLAHKKDKKVLIFKKRRRGGYTKKQGHRQAKSEILIESVAL